MMNNCTVLFLLIVLLAIKTAQAQVFSGVVRDAVTGEPIPGVSIQRLGTIKGTTTNRSGNFALYALPQGPIRLWVSSVGYRPEPIEVVVEGQKDQFRTVLLQPTSIQLNQQTITTAQRVEETDFTRPEITTVLTSRDLRQRAPRTAPEALFGATGVWIQKTNHGGGSPFVRGLTGQQTLILVDGIRLNNATFRSGPNQYLNTIDPQSIEQIEVVRSSGSTAYGSDAIGGVVNVRTKSPEFSDKPTIGGLYFGKVATQGMEYSNRAELAYSTRSISLLGGLAYRRFGDLVAGQGLGRQTPTGYSQLSGDLKARFKVTNQTIATVAYQDLRQDSVPVYHRVKVENYRYYQFNPQRRQLTYARLDHFFGYRWLQSAQLTASWQRQTEGRQSQRNGAPTAVYERDQTSTTGLTFLTTAEPTPFWQVRNGVEWYADRVRSSRSDVNTTAGTALIKRGLYPDRATMNSMALFSLHTLTLSRMVLTAGGRYQYNQITVPETANGKAVVRPSAVVGNVGASYAVSPSVRLVGSMQSAFRAPNIDDLGTLGIVDFRYEVPNAHLRPERSRGVEAGVKVRSDKLSASFLGYYNQLSDFITRVRLNADSIQGYPVYVKQNSARSFIRGFEGEAEYELCPRMLLFAGATYTYGQNVSANEPFRRIPPLNGRLGLTYGRNGWWARAEGLWAGAQRRLAKGDTEDNRMAKGGTPGWKIINLNGGYRWKCLTVSAELQNLTNKPYRTHGSGVDGVGRSGWLSVLVNW